MLPAYRQPRAGGRVALWSCYPELTLFKILSGGVPREVEGSGRGSIEL